MLGVVSLDLFMSAILFGFLYFFMKQRTLLQDLPSACGIFLEIGPPKPTWRAGEAVHAVALTMP
jgi:hypothetical protein